MTNWLTKQHKNRCEGKAAFRKASRADKVAQRMTHRRKELFVSYECCDCGMWHVGHADTSQLMARVPTSKPTCTVCGKLIHESRLQKAKLSGNRTTTCSKECAQEATRRRTRLGKLAKQQARPPEEPSQS